MNKPALALAAAVLLPAFAAMAQPAPPTPAGTAPITGQDPMGDKDRSGPDGWVMAPMNRTDSNGGRSPSERSGHSRSNDPTASAPAPHSSAPMPPGQDPGTPNSPTGNGPGVSDVPAAQR